MKPDHRKTVRARNMMLAELKVRQHWMTPWEQRKYNRFQRQLTFTRLDHEIMRQVHARLTGPAWDARE